MNKKILLIFMMIILALPMVSATTYYVNTTGNTTPGGSGTEADPWLNISAHIGSRNAGDILYIYNGTYNETDTALSGLYTGDGDKFSIIGESREGVIINIAASATAGFYLIDASMSFYNLTLNGSGSVLSNGITFRSNAGSVDDLVIHNVLFKNFNKAISVHSIIHTINNVNMTNNTFQDNTFVLAQGASDLIYGNSTFANNTVVNGTYFLSDLTGGLYDSYNDGDRLAILNNTINVTTFFIKNLAQTSDLTNNTITFEKLLFEDITFSSNYVYSNEIFNFRNITKDGYHYYIRLNNVSNLVFENISFCNSTSMCSFNNFTSSGYPVLIYADADSSNITINHSYFYINESDDVRIIHSLANKTIVDSNYFTMNATAGWATYITAHDVQIINNTGYVTSIDQSISYFYGCGYEGLPVNGRYDNCTIENNWIDANADNTSVVLHTIFLGYTTNSLVNNNTIYGGGYGFATKGNINATINNSRLYEGANTISIIEKGGTNNTFSNLYIYEDGTDFAIESRWDNDEGNAINVTNSHWENITVECATCGIKVSSYANVLFYNVTGYATTTIATGANLSKYFKLALTSPTSVLYTLTRNDSLVDGNYNTSTTTSNWLKYSWSNSTLTHLYNYTINATKNNWDEEQNFTISTNRELNLTYLNISTEETAIAAMDSDITAVAFEDTSNTSLSNNISIDQNMSLLMTLTTNTKTATIDLLEFEGTYMYWDTMNFTIDTSTTSTYATNVNTNASITTDYLVLFNNTDSFLPEANFGSGVKIKIAAVTAPTSVVFVANDTGVNTTAITTTCNVSGPTLPVTTSNMCYYDDGTDLYVWIPHLSGIAIDMPAAATTTTDTSSSSSDNDDYVTTSSSSDNGDITTVYGGLDVIIEYDDTDYILDMAATVADTTVDFTIEGTEYSMEEGDYIEIDLDGDGNKDISIKVEDIRRPYADLLIKELIVTEQVTPDVEEEPEVPTTEEVLEEIETTSNALYWIWASITILILGFGSYFVYWKKR